MEEEGEGSRDKRNWFDRGLEEGGLVVVNSLGEEEEGATDENPISKGSRKLRYEVETRS